MSSAIKIVTMKVVNAFDLPNKYQKLLFEEPLDYSNDYAEEYKIEECTSKQDQNYKLYNDLINF